MANQELKTGIKKALKRLRGRAFRALRLGKESFDCPLCAYTGPFMDAHDPTGLRLHAMCPNCSAQERHRILWLTIQRLGRERDLKKLSILHFAPEPELAQLFRLTFGEYKSADLMAPGVDFHVDLRNLPFASGTFDVVVASHVLEHIKEDHLALRNIHRILRPGGFAILQVPVIGTTTIEYPEPNSAEWDHVRAPGVDYFDRYLDYFPRVDKFTSSDFDKKYQPFVFENRMKWPKDFPLRQTTPGHRHDDIVPICYATL